jgi:hypothetical protein
VSIRDVRVDDEGIRLHCDTDVVVDALFDGRRIWSFRPQRDGSADGHEWYVEWPATLRSFLDGRTELTLAVHGAEGAPAFQEEVAFGSSDGRIAIVNASGKPLALDKDLRRVQTFDTRTREHVQPLLDAIARVLGALREAGIDGFLAYGTLLGAVREGQLIGHDSDADLGYVSRHEEPADVTRESFAIQRRLVRMGYTIVRYSGAAFKVEVTESDGTVRGLDVFGGFMRDGHLHLMGEIRAPFERDWVEPLGVATLEGREFPVPRDPDRFLAATYGEQWRTPDPAFHFETPRSTSRRLTGWFRGIFVGRPTWDRAYANNAYARGKGPSGLCEWMAEREGGMRSFVDIGCGRGRDVAFVARRDVPALGLDLVPKAFEQMAKRWEPERAAFWTFNVYEDRHVAVAVARAALMPQPRVVMARHLVDTLSATGRAKLWRTARGMLGGPDERLYLEFLTVAGTGKMANKLHAEPVAAALVRAELEASGARVVHEEEITDGRGPDASTTCRMVAEWDR